MASSGGPRGFAHIGVLKVLEDEDIHRNNRPLARLAMPVVAVLPQLRALATLSEKQARSIRLARVATAVVS
jgi:hypothetical protein